MIEINLSESGFNINNVTISFPTDLKTLATALSPNYRSVKKKYNTIHTWDELGILAYSKDGKTIDGLLLEFELKEIDFSPQQLFQGKFIFDNQEILDYYHTHKDKRIKLFDGDTSGALVLNGICVWFDIKNSDLKELEIKAFKGVRTTNIPKEKYEIQPLQEETIEFVDLGFKLSIIQDLMYDQELLLPKFDLHEFAKWYSHRTIDLEKEGYEPISEVTQYFKDLPIPKRLATEVTEIYQDGGNDIYLNLIRFAEGYEDYWDIESIEDIHHFPNLKEATICYAKEGIVDELNKKGISAEWL